VTDVHSAIDYAQVRVGDVSFVLPQAIDDVVESTSGMVSYNRTLYQSCREYTAESTIRFEEIDSEQAKVPARAATLSPVISPGALLDTNLRSALTIDHCAVGDRVVLSARPLERRRLTLPETATVQGRITDMQTWIDRGKQTQYVTLLKMRFSKLDAGVPMAFHAQLKNRSSAPNLQYVISSGTELSVRFSGQTLSTSIHFQWEISE